MSESVLTEFMPIVIPSCGQGIPAIVIFIWYSPLTSKDYPGSYFLPHYKFSSHFPIKEEMLY